jgi:hypothetical protein
MIRTILLIILAPLLSLATDPTFKIHGKEVKFYDYKDYRITTSQKCDSLSKQNKFCKELEFLLTLKEKVKDANLGPNQGGMNPGSRICSDVLKGIVVMGIDKDKNENSFCKLKSNLYIDSGTLAYYYLKP